MNEHDDSQLTTIEVISLDISHFLSAVLEIPTISKRQATALSRHMVNHDVRNRKRENARSSGSRLGCPVCHCVVAELSTGGLKEHITKRFNNACYHHSDIIVYAYFNLESKIRLTNLSYMNILNTLGFGY